MRLTVSADDEWNDHVLTVVEIEPQSDLLVSVHKRGDEPDAGATVKMTRAEFCLLGERLETTT